MNVTKIHQIIPRKLPGLLFVLLMIIALLGLVGCGGSGQTGSSGPLPAPSAPAVLQGYLGTQGAQYGSIGGVWQMSLNDTGHTYNIPLSSDLVQDGTGTTTLSNSVLQLAGVDAGNIGYAVEIPGRAVLYRPCGPNESTQTAPVIFVAQGACLNLNSTATFQFVQLPDMRWNPATDWAYGSVQTSTSGTQWSFSNLSLFTQSGNSVQAPAMLPAVCGASKNGNLISSLPDTANNIPATTIGVGPTGFFFADASLNSVPNGPGQSGTYLVSALPAKVGVIQPASALDTSAVMAAKYTGLLFEPCPSTSNGISCGEGGNANDLMTKLVAFVPGSSGALIGGGFPSSFSASGGIAFDLTQSPANNVGIMLGSQDSKNNGLYKTALATLPDPNSLCLSTTGAAGKDTGGNPTCTVPAVAVVGNPEGKYAIFLIAEDLLTSRPLGIYLYQQ